MPLQLVKEFLEAQFQAGNHDYIMDFCLEMQDLALEFADRVLKTELRRIVQFEQGQLCKRLKGH
jgi:hypothetical protein